MNHLARLALFFSLAVAAVLPARASDTAFTYQGALKNSGVLVSGTYAMTFRLYAAAQGGSPLATQSLPAVVVTQGLFAVDLDFGTLALASTDRWLEVQVGATTLTPRHKLTATPRSGATRGIYVDDQGRVGLGGTFASELLTLRSTDANILLLSQQNPAGPHITLRNPSGSNNTTHGEIRFDDGSLVASLRYSKPLVGSPGLFVSGPNSTHMKILDNGRIGLGGELEPLALLHLQGASNLGASALTNEDLIIESQDAILGLYSSPGGSLGSGIALGEVSGGTFNDKWTIVRGTTGVGSALHFVYGSNPNYAQNVTRFTLGASGHVIVPAGGRVGVGTADPQVPLHVAGIARVSVLEVTGADLAERFPTAHDSPIEPGTVMEIDPDRPGHLRVSTGPRSTRVAGVVSGAGGLAAGTIMGNLPGLEEAPAIALSGRVWVLCDATEAPIAIGDLLTTATTPGHAMRAGLPAPGAILGKAMTALPCGQTGLVLVLVSLQ